MVGASAALGSLTGPASIEFVFPTQGGGTSHLRLPFSELRHPQKLLDQFSMLLPIFPTEVDETDTARTEYIQDLASSAVSFIELLPTQTGFIDKDTFVTHSEIIRSDGTRSPIPKDDAAATHTYSDIKGDLEGTTAVLKMALYSTYLTFGFGVGLAAPLPAYVNLWRGEGDDVAPLVRETAVFNTSGTSSSGKSSVGLAALTLAGSSERAGSLDFSRRGLAEMASGSNGLVLVLDDTEKAEDGPGVLVKALKSLVHMVPGGKSKNISRGADQFPLLHWSTFALSSSPRSIPKLAQEAGWKMSPGDKVRLFDISVPGPKKGGIFDRIGGNPANHAASSVKLIRKLERGYSNHCGHVMPLFALHLMAKNRSKEIITWVNDFNKHVEARGHGWELRFAQKFGVIYAAMMMGIDAGLLPWPASLPLKVVTKCYRKARNSAKTAHERAAEATAKLQRLLKQDRRVVDASNRGPGAKPLKLTGRCIAIRYIKEGRTKYGVLDDALLKILGSKAAKASFTKGLASAGLLPKGHGHAGTVQERIKIERDGEIIERPRLWVIDAEAFSRLVSKGSGS